MPKTPQPFPTKRLLISASLAGLLMTVESLGTVAAKAADQPPRTLGACSSSTVQSKRFRMAPSPGDPNYKPSENPAGKEVLISLNNGIGVYAGDGDAFILSPDFAPGHRVKVCLVEVPKNCPPGDNRGKIYTLRDRETGRTVRGIDSWHLCGGA